MTYPPLIHCNYNQERIKAFQYREALKVREFYQCKDCGKKLYFNDRNNDDSLIVHHVIPIINGGITEESNLVILCNDCHDKRHRDLRVKPELPLFRIDAPTKYYKGGYSTNWLDICNEYRQKAKIGV